MYGAPFALNKHQKDLELPDMISLEAYQKKQDDLESEASLYRRLV